MKIPGFSAEACIEERRNRWSHRQEASGRQRGKPQGPVLVPQLGGKGYEGKGSCIDRCVDTHPRWPVALCRKACRTADGPPPPPADPTNRDIGIGGCWAWWAFCKADPFMFFCDEVRDHCIADNE